MERIVHGRDIMKRLPLLATLVSAALTGALPEAGFSQVVPAVADGSVVGAAPGSLRALPCGPVVRPSIRRGSRWSQRPVFDYRIHDHTSYRDQGGPLESLLTTMFRRSWLRLEYLNWDVDSPGNVLVGAPVSNVADPTQPFEIFDTGGGGGSLGQAIVETLNPSHFRDAGGGRGTLGIPMNGLTLEVASWGLEQTSEQQLRDNISAPRVDLNATPPPNPALGTATNPNVIISLLFNGAPSDSNSLFGLVFDDRISTNVSTQAWGTEFNFIADHYNAGMGLKWQPLAGFRYINLQEDFNVVGIFNNGGTQADRTSVLSSMTHNNIYGPQVGFRTEFVHEWFTLNLTPRIMFGLNNYLAELRTGPLLAATDAVVESRDTRVDFTPMVQVSASLTVHCNEFVSVFFGYDFLWLNRVTRPWDNIRYDSFRDANTGVLTPNISLDDALGSFQIEGMSIGMVIRFP